MAALASSGEWDAVVDTSGYVPRVVRDSARALASNTGLYVYLSTVSVYQAWPDEGVSEDAAVRECLDIDLGGAAPTDAAEYGRFKRGCENAASAAFGAARTLVLRPGVIIGPWENVGRLPWWLSRFARGGRVLGPGRPDRAIQPIDVRDVAAFALDSILAGVSGVFNVTAPCGHTTMGTLLSECDAATSSARTAPTEVTWADGDWLEAKGVRQWTELPLWREAPGTWLVDSTRAQGAGLVCRPIAETVRDTWALLAAGERPVEHPRQADHGIAPERERALLEELGALGQSERARGRR